MKAAITIDVDSLRLYHQVHGLPPPDLERDPIYTHALPRFWELMDGRPATLFLIGADAPQHPEAFAPVLPTGCEIASHSFDHDYRLSRRPPAEITEDLERAEEALARLAGGARPVGFRAPGYNVSRALLEALVARGYTYDSSLLPAPYYYAARAGVLGWYRLRGRRSKSLAGDPRAFWGPAQPYRTRPDRYWAPDPQGPLRELPMAVEPATRLPLIGTSWVLWPRAFREALLERTLAAEHPFVFEMHAIDLLDASDPHVPRSLREHQPDLRRPAREKIHALRALIERVAQSAPVTTLADLARTV